MITKENYTCPKCQNTNRIKTYSFIDHTNIKRVINKEIFTNICSKCGESIDVFYPLKIVGENYIIHYTPNENAPITDAGKRVLRVCDTFADLKEKILILEDNLNDIVIEFIKDYIIYNLDEKTKNEVEGIRYNNCDKDNLYFQLLGSETKAVCSYNKYCKLLKKIKIKKINQCVLIDSYTYKNYYRMRLL